LNETKLTNLIDDSNFEHVHYCMYRRDRGDGRLGGGIMVFIKKTLKHYKVVIEQDIEMINLVFELREKFRVSLIACYRPPHRENEDLFFSGLEKRVIEADTSSN
ncbi:MAG: hypothetical protein QG594_1964, partial [Bacteroidota bacterium]|nr:hypothetical protein [Bacteroidota bacterium]